MGALDNSWHIFVVVESKLDTPSRVIKLILNSPERLNTRRRELTLEAMNARGKSFKIYVAWCFNFINP